jgi:hypothetical protein
MTTTNNDTTLKIRTTWSAFEYDITALSYVPERMTYLIAWKIENYYHVYIETIYSYNQKGIMGLVPNGFNITGIIKPNKLYDRDAAIQIYGQPLFEEGKRRGRIGSKGRHPKYTQIQLTQETSTNQETICN